MRSDSQFLPMEDAPTLFTVFRNGCRPSDPDLTAHEDIPKRVHIRVMQSGFIPNNQSQQPTENLS